MKKIVYLGLCMVLTGCDDSIKTLSCSGDIKDLEKEKAFMCQDQLTDTVCYADIDEIKYIIHCKSGNTNIMCLSLFNAGIETTDYKCKLNTGTHKVTCKYEIQNGMGVITCSESFININDII